MPSLDWPHAAAPCWATHPPCLPDSSPLKRCMWLDTTLPPHWLVALLWGPRPLGLPAVKPVLARHLWSVAPEQPAGFSILATALAAAGLHSCPSLTRSAGAPGLGLRDATTAPSISSARCTQPSVSSWSDPSKPSFSRGRAFADVQLKFDLEPSLASLCLNLELLDSWDCP